MVDILCVIIIFLALTTVIDMRGLPRELTGQDNDSDTVRSEQGTYTGDLSENEVRKTIELIGEDAFRKMSERIDEILRSNAGRQALTLDLTCGPDTPEGAETLHTLLPGTSLQLVSCQENGVDMIDIYTDGRRIGRLALSEVETLRSIMKENSLRTAYVAEQNCYGIENSHTMSIVIYYEPRNECKTHISHYAKNLLRSNGATPIHFFCQN